MQEKIKWRRRSEEKKKGEEKKRERKKVRANVKIDPRCTYAREQPWKDVTSIF